MKKINILICLFLLVGCKQLEGEKGEKGDPGPGTITRYTGVISSDTHVVSVPAFNTYSDISVLIGDLVNFTEAPYYVPAGGYNVFYLTSSGSITIYNAKTAGAVYYKIFVVTSASSAGLKALSN